MQRIEWEVDGASAAAVLRPDSQWALLLPEDVGTWRRLLAARPSEATPAAVSVADDAARGAVLTEAGFSPGRVEQLWHLPVEQLRTPAIARAGGRSEHTLVPVTECDIAQVAALDTVVRRQIPGTANWVSTPADMCESFRDEEFDPELYLIAQHPSTGAYEGLVRIWWREPRPRVGCIGVVPELHRTSLAAALLGAVAQILSNRGVVELEAETDLTNRGSHPMARRHGGIEVGREVEWTLASD